MNDELKKYLALYSSLVSNVTKQIPSDLKWVTFLVNKDRFYSKFLFRFESLFLNKPQPVYLTAPDNLYFLRFCYYVVRTSFLIFLCRLQFGKKIKQLAALFQGRDIRILHSICYESSMKNGTYTDPFWENLVDYYNHQQISTVRLILPVNLKIYSFFKINAKCQAVLPWFSFNSFLDPYKIAFKIFKEYLTSPTIKAEFKQFDISALIEQQYREDIFNIIGFYGLLMAKGVEQLKENYSVNYFLYPYENNCWEKILLISLKENFKNISLTGYQHTVIPLSATNYFLSKDDSQIPLPDKIITTGTHTANLLRDYGNYPEKCLIKPACAVRFKNSEVKALKVTPSPIKKILVALHGVNTIVPMINYLINESYKNQDIQFIFRFHPMVEYKKIKNDLIAKLGESENLVLSKNVSLDYDLQRSDIVIYGESTVCLEALAIGVPIICFKLTSTFLNYDPIPELKTNKWLINETSDLSLVLKEINQLSAAAHLEMGQDGQKYAQGYLAPISAETLLVFL